MTAVASERSAVAPLAGTPCPGCGAAAAHEVCVSRAQMQSEPEYFRWVACNTCELIYLDPPVPESEIGRYYRDYLPHRGPSAWGKWAPLVAGDLARIDRARVAVLGAAGAPSTRTALLDVGCGRPTFLRLAHQTFGCRSVGTDLEPDGWSEPGQWGDLELHAGLLDALDLNGPFNHITLWQALEHCEHPVAVLRRLRSLAAPGATIIVEVPDHSGLTRHLHGEYWAGYHTPRHYAAYTPATLRRVLIAAGWQVSRQYQWGTLDPYILWWLGQQERLGRSLSGSLESRFIPFVLGKVAALPITLLQRWLPLGFQTAIATA